VEPQCLQQPPPEGCVGMRVYPTVGRIIKDVEGAVRVMVKVGVIVCDGVKVFDGVKVNVGVFVIVGEKVIVGVKVMVGV
jgi:hypothetical protein